VTETLRDGFDIRRAAAEKRIPCLTSIDTARAAISSLVRKDTEFTIQPLRDYLAHVRVETPQTSRNQARDTRHEASQMDTSEHERARGVSGRGVPPPRSPE
jgi:hypothetical protein